ncbi:hypothetical protein SAMN05444157_2947 [Frankineae bacterium MT45]|nr:hypothetical protein SAMN05444157_2947 [Frankineae bacterium MT45]
MNESGAASGGSHLEQPSVDHLQRENAALADELTAARADVELLQTQLAEIGSLRRHVIRTLVDRLHAGDQQVRQALATAHPFEPASVETPPAPDAESLLGAAAAADRRSADAYLAPAPRSRLLRWYEHTSRRAYGAAVDRYRRRRRNSR